MSVSLVDGHIDSDAPRMTDNEIIKALECCCSPKVNACDDCPFYERCYNNNEWLEKEAIDLINRKNAEIESKNDLIHRQSDVISEQKEKLESIYSEAIKEFAERLKEMSDISGDIPGWKDVIINEMDIDNLVKEMVGDTK